MGALMHCKFDKFHRVIRDIKLFIGRCCSSLFLKAQLYTTLIWGINYKPFGSGLVQHCASATELQTSSLTVICTSHVHKSWQLSTGVQFIQPRDFSENERLNKSRAL